MEQKSAYKSFLKTKTFNEDNKSQHSKLNEGKILQEDYEDLKSRRTQKSRQTQKSEGKINI